MAKARTRLVRNLLNLLGYDLRRLQKTHIHDRNPGWKLDYETGFDGFETIIPRPVIEFDIIFRSCARVEVFGQDRKRLLGVPKSEVLLRCLNSLIHSINHASDLGLDTAIRLTVLDDHSSDECVQQINSLLKFARCETRYIALETTGNGPSVGSCYRWARDNARDIIYFVEDDYLHDERSIFETIKSYERLAAVLKSDIVLFPTDKPDLYRDIDQTQVFPGSHRHWRTIANTTFTSITSLKILKAHWASYIGLEKYGIDHDVTEETTLNHVYRTVPCLSPMPGLAVHFQQIDELSPFNDWQGWWDTFEISPAQND